MQASSWPELYDTLVWMRDAVANNLMNSILFGAQRQIALHLAHKYRKMSYSAATALARPLSPPLADLLLGAYAKAYRRAKAIRLRRNVLVTKIAEIIPSKQNLLVIITSTLLQRSTIIYNVFKYVVFNIIYNIIMNNF